MLSSRERINCMAFTACCQSRALGLVNSLRTVLPTAKNARYIAVLVGYQGEGILPPVQEYYSTLHAWCQVSQPRCQRGERLAQIRSNSMRVL